jgi:hypothetical protein
VFHLPLTNLTFAIIETLRFGTDFSGQFNTERGARRAGCFAKKMTQAATKRLQANSGIEHLAWNQREARGMVALPGIEPGFED